MAESGIGEKLAAVRERIRAAAARAGRPPEEIRLIAVSKGQPPAAIAEALAAGQCEFGENYLEEAAAKIQALPNSVMWHMIGHVQGRKARGVAELFSSVHSVDSLALAGRLSQFAAAAGKTLPIFLECNVSGEASKYGWAAADPAAWPGLFPAWERIAALPGLRIAGLMTMAPFGTDPEAARLFFRKLRNLRDAARGALSALGLDGLSMGMSDDFEVAVEEGATMLRVGRAIFGPRA